MAGPEPPRHVLQAFAATGAPRPLAGGQGSSWVAGDLVLKPDGGPVAEWVAGVTAALSPVGVRIAPPVATVDGEWTHDGWSATRRVDGASPDFSSSSTWTVLIEAGRAFHRAVSQVSAPSCLDERTDPWALADRVAWGERPLLLRPELAGPAQRLEAALAPLGPPQVVHGDLTGNVLFAAGSLPAVIDISPYWRPPAYAEGIVLADALCWHGAPASILGVTGVTVPAVARALLFRLVTTDVLAATGVAVDVADEARRYRRAVEVLGL